MTVDELRAALPAATSRIYLNTGTSGPTPRPAAEAQIALLRLFVEEGFASPASLKAYAEALERARSSLARFLGCEAQSVALLHSTSEAIGTVAAGLRWKPGDEVIVSDLEHVSGIAPWLHLARTRGVRVVHLKSEGGTLRPEAVKAQVTERTRLDCISHVSYATGAVLSVEESCRIARDAGALSLVDGAQGAGCVPFDVASLGCDFYAMPGQKWLLGPEGTGALYVASRALEALEPTRVGWASLADEDAAGGGIVLSPAAKRFESGTVHAPAFAGLEAALRFLGSFGWDRVYERIRSLAARAREALRSVRGVRLVTPSDSPTGLVTFEVEGKSPERVVRELWEKRRIVVRSIPSPRAVRACFHAFNTEEELEQFIQALAEVLGGDRAG